MSIDLFNMLEGELQAVRNRVSNFYNFWGPCEQAAKDALKKAQQDASKEKLVEALQKPNRDMFKFFGVPDAHAAAQALANDAEARVTPFYEKLQEAKKDWLLNGMLEEDMREFALEFLDDLKKLEA